MRLGAEWFATLDPRSATAAFSVSFEDVALALESLDRMLLEPDGSFVWKGIHSGRPWQLDGMIYDRNGRVVHVEVQGTCPLAAFDRLLAALGWPAALVMFELRRAGVILDEAEFRRCATTPIS